MNTVGIKANCAKKRSVEVVERALLKADEIGLKLLLDGETARLIGRDDGVETQTMIEQADGVMALGGDGTVLRTVRELEASDKPVIGVNIGSLGFLTSVAENDLERALDCLKKNDFTVTVRSLVAAVVHGSNDQETSHEALNEVLLAGEHSSRVITIAVDVDGEYVTSYICDGLMVSTPTGSTGHSLSAGGPIVRPETSVFVISPVCPHTLSSRPLVIPESSEVKMTVKECAGSVRMAADGQKHQSLGVGDTVEIKKSARAVRLVHLPGYSYFAVLRQKLNWSGSSI